MLPHCLLWRVDEQSSVLDVASLCAVCGDERSSVVDVASLFAVCGDEQSSVLDVASLFAVMCEMSRAPWWMMPHC